MFQALCLWFIASLLIGLALPWPSSMLVSLAVWCMGLAVFRVTLALVERVTGMEL